jgi:hypothetical protein
VSYECLEEMAIRGLARMPRCLYPGVVFLGANILDERRGQSLAAQNPRKSPSTLIAAFFLSHNLTENLNQIGFAAAAVAPLMRVRLARCLVKLNPGMTHP